MPYLSQVQTHLPLLHLLLAPARACKAADTLHQKALLLKSFTESPSMKLILKHCKTCGLSIPKWTVLCACQ